MPGPDPISKIFFACLWSLLVERGFTTSFTSQGELAVKAATCVGFLISIEIISPVSLPYCFKFSQKSAEISLCAIVDEQKNSMKVNKYFCMKILSVSMNVYGD